MKIAHVTAIDGALRRLLLNQLRVIQDAGHEVVGISSPGPHVSVIERHGIRHVAVPIQRRISPLKDLSSLGQLYQLFRRERFDLVHTHNPKPGLLGQLAARWAGVPIVVNTVHGFYFDEHTPRVWRRIWIASERLAARCSDLIFSQNDEDIETAVRENIAPREKLRYLGNGIDIERFSRARLNHTTVTRLRAELRLDSGAFTVGFVGRMVREKGVLELFQALAEVRKQHRPLQAIFVGRVDNDRGDAVSPERAAEFGITDCCRFAGVREEIPELLSLMDVLVLPSHREGFPRAPMEAAAMGVPCIVTNIRGCRQTVEHGRNGLLIPLKDPPALANAILQILADPHCAKEMQRAARQMAEERFDERRVFERVLSEYQRLSHSKGLVTPL